MQPNWRLCLLSSILISLVSISTILLIISQVEASIRNSYWSGQPQLQQIASYNEQNSFELECLSEHNKWRSMHQVEPLSYDPKLTAFAQKRAYAIAKSGYLWHAHSKYGENLAWHSWPSTGCSTLVKMWYDEIHRVKHQLSRSYASIYSRSVISGAGHFTQLVWPRSRRVGCARAFAPGQRGGVYLVCVYDPAGNVVRRQSYY